MCEYLTSLLVFSVIICSSSISIISIIYSEQNSD